MIATIRVKSSLSPEIDKIDKKENSMWNEGEFALTASHGIYIIWESSIKHIRARVTENKHQ